MFASRAFANYIPYKEALREAGEKSVAINIVFILIILPAKKINHSHYIYDKYQIQ